MYTSSIIMLISWPVLILITYWIIIKAVKWYEKQPK